MATDERQSRRRTLLGGLLIIAIIGSAVLVFTLDRIIESFRSEAEVVAIVDNAPGITTGSAVWIDGKAVGAVSRVEFLPSRTDTARIALTMRVPAKLRAQVRSDSRVRLASSSLIGARVVDILPGSPSAAVIGPGDTLRERRMASPAELTARAAAVRADLDTVLVAVRELTPAARSALERTRVAMVGMSQAMAEARSVQADLQSSPGIALLGSAEFAASLQSARSHVAELPAVLSAMQERAGGSSEVGAAIARLQARADSLGVQLATMSEMIDQPNSSLARFSQDTALARALTAARAELDSLMADVRRNPLRFVF